MRAELRETLLLTLGYLQGINGSTGHVQVPEELTKKIERALAKPPKITVNLKKTEDGKGG